MNEIYANIQDPDIVYDDKGSKGLTVLVVGHPGCLDGDSTLIRYSRGARGGSREITLRNLYYKFNGIKSKGKDWTNLDWPTYTHSINSTGMVFYNRILAVLFSGIKPCIRVIQTDGPSLICTADHPFLTTNYTYEKAENLEGKQVLTLGSMLPKPGNGKAKKPPRTTIYTRFHPYACQRIVRPAKCKHEYIYRQSHKARLVIDAELNGYTYDELLDILNSDELTANGLKYLPSYLEVHHKDGNTLNDARENLEVLSKDAHARLHGKTGNFNTDYYKASTIERIEWIGPRETFDITMEPETPNYAANGFFVHNTWKTSVAAQWPGVVFLSIASEGGDDALKTYPQVAQRLISMSKMKECPPVFNSKVPPRWEIRTCEQFNRKVDEIVKNHKRWGICTVVIDQLNYLIDLWIDELMNVKEKNDRSWAEQVRKRGGEFMGPAEWGLLNMFLRSIRVSLSNCGLNVIWNCLQKDSYRQSKQDMMGAPELAASWPMIQGGSKVTLPGACKLHILAERKLVTNMDQGAMGTMKMQPVWRTSPTPTADWLRHKYFENFPTGKLVDPEFGEVPTFRAFWYALHQYIYTGQ